ncbi:MAG: ATP-binding protein [Endomicrobiales bacterium]|jgi:hypothetical protein
MNPFIYGEEVSGEHFINRRSEIEELTRDLSDSQKIFLIARRRYGKTSLLQQVKDKLNQKKIKVVYVDIFQCASLEQFVAKLAKSMSILETTKIENAMKLIKEWISSLRPQFSINREGELSVQIDSMPQRKETLDILEEVLEYSQKYAEKNNAHVVVMFDEFQEILKYGGESLEKFLRAIIQKQRRVGYIFCGSRRSILNDMATKESRAFYNSGPIVYLDKINEREWEKYIKSAYLKGKYKIDNDVPGQIMKHTENIPYYVQALAHELWDEKNENKIIESGDVEKAVISIIKKRTPTYDTLWSMLPGTQQRLLMGMCATESNLFSSAFIIKNQLGSRTTVEQAIKLLEKKDIIEKDAKEYVFVDLWFKKWVFYLILG